MSRQLEIAYNQLDQQDLSFQCMKPKSYAEMQDHRAELCADIIKKFAGTHKKIVDAGCGDKFLGKQFPAADYTGVDLLYGDDIEESIPEGDVTVFLNVLEHLVDVRKVLDNVRSEWVYVSVPVERDLPSIDHMRKIDYHLISEFMPCWELVGKWFWVMVPRFAAWRRFMPGVSSFAEDEVTLWRVTQ